MSEACLEKPADIVEDSFNPAFQMIASFDGSSQDPSHALVYHQYASFAEHQYYSIINSPDAIRFKVYVDRKTQEIKERQHELSRTQVESPMEFEKLRRVQSKAQAQLTEDRKSFLHHEEARVKFLRQAIDMCARSMQISDAFDEDAAIRLCSLWFANFHDDDLQNVVGESLDRVASRKFVFLAHQLSARLWKSQANEAEPNQENLQRLVLRMCREHPFHSLYQVHCLCADRPLASSTKRQSSRLESQLSHSERAAAAQDILSLLRQDANHGERILAVEKICDACLEWAKFPVKEGSRSANRKQNLPIPRDLQIRRIGLTKVPVLTINTPLDPTLRYEDCVWINGYEDTFDLLGGINVPKVTFCRGSDGTKYTQLVRCLMSF
jgi:ataxia telangiectasia mutated family protein